MAWPMPAPDTHELAGDHADEGIGDRELRAGEQPRRGGRQDDVQQRTARRDKPHHRAPCAANARGTRASPSSVLIATATTANMKPIATSGQRFSPNSTMNSG